MALITGLSEEEEAKLLLLNSDLDLDSSYQSDDFTASSRTEPTTTLQNNKYQGFIKQILLEYLHLILPLDSSIAATFEQCQQIHHVKVEIILKEREVAFLSPRNMPSAFEFFLLRTRKIQMLTAYSWVIRTQPLSLLILFLLY